MTVVVVVGAAVLLASGDDGTGGEVELGPVTSFEDIAGTTYQRLGGQAGYMHIFEDGTMHWSPNPYLVEDHPVAVAETRFEGTTLFLTTTKGQCSGYSDSTFEIHLLENGNLEFVVIEDSCTVGSNILTAEWVPVP